MEIPLSRPDVGAKEIEAVVEVLSGPTLSIGPKIEEFEGQVAKLTGRRYAIGVSSGTAGLHCVMAALGIGEGDEVVHGPADDQPVRDAADAGQGDGAELVRLRGAVLEKVLLAKKKRI